MWELLSNAWKGWLEYTTHGKFAALLLAVLLFLWLCRREREHRLLVFYTTLMTILCIFPVSAAVLMLYQTKFYDYQWIWNLVPVTVMIAFGATVFLTEYWESYHKKQGLNKWAVTFLVLAAILLCGSVGNAKWEEQAVLSKSGEAASVVEALKASSEGEEICLWAPHEIMEYARAADGSVKLPYGRNMWDKALNAYSYDTYSQERVDCYQWMEAAEETGELASGKEQLSGEECVRTAMKLGVNRLLLPKNMQQEAVEQLENALGVQARELAGYYYFVLQ